MLSGMAGIVGDVKALPRLVVVSLHKSGTHLVLRLIEALGYQRRYFDDVLIPKVRIEPPAVFLAGLEPNAAYFLHECPVDGFPRNFLEHWRANNDPLFVYQYRDPRAVLLSQVNYLRRSHRGREFSNTAYHVMFSDVLAAQRTERDALSVAIDCMGDYLLKSFLGSVWMLHHPNVLTLSYERLVGAEGGGSALEQAGEVARLLQHLGIEGNPQQIAARLYDPSQRTFHRGTADSWKQLYTREQLEQFESRYGHLLDIYSYPRASAPR
jgi:hypothetical protein